MELTFVNLNMIMILMSFTQVKDLQPPDHLDAVRLEQDGHLNRDYRKEIFLGNHEDFEQNSEAEIEKKLKDIFHK